MLTQQTIFSLTHKEVQRWHIQRRKEKNNLDLFIHTTYSSEDIYSIQSNKSDDWRYIECREDTNVYLLLYTFMSLYSSVSNLYFMRYTCIYHEKQLKSSQTYMSAIQFMRYIISHNPNLLHGISIFDVWFIQPAIQGKNKYRSKTPPSIKKLPTSHTLYFNFWSLIQPSNIRES